MEKSIAKQVEAFLAKKPGAENQDLYDFFPEIRKSTLRHYRSKFGIASPKSPKKKAAPVKKKAATVRKKASPVIKEPSSLKPEITHSDNQVFKEGGTFDLEQRIEALEGQIERLREVLHDLPTDRIQSGVEMIRNRFKNAPQKISEFLKNLRNK